MKITVEDIKKAYMSKYAGSLPADPESSEEINFSKLASSLRHMADTGASDDTALLYLSMIKEAREKAKARLGLGERLSLR